MHFVYIVECADKTLYTGWTTDLKARIKAHNSGNGAKYTKVRLPVKLVYNEVFDDKSTALKREIEIKKLSRKQKTDMIKEKIMKITVNKHKCPQNHKCPSIAVCPVGAISQEEVNSLPKIDAEKCIVCGKCMKFCPKGAFEKA